MFALFIGSQRLILSRFPYSIVFRERLHDIQIIAVAHAKRRPGYWSNRL
jgi:toxin ParE1/3/4